MNLVVNYLKKEAHDTMVFCFQHNKEEKEKRQTKWIE
jgi:hypothetical protein